MAHEPVLLAEVLSYLVPPLERSGVLVDCTLGRAGHARALLYAGPGMHLVGIDRDASALEASGTLLGSFGERVRLVHDNYSNLAAILERLGATPVRGVLLDLGVSSPQLDEGPRGFSYREDGPLDMRMDPTQDLTAADVVNRYAPKDLERLIKHLGEERFAARISRAIVDARPLKTTAHLADVVRAAIPAAARRTGPHPARRTFQAIRMEVNDELGELERALPQVVDVLEPGGRAAVLTYHSLEDRAVKRFFADEARDCICPADFPVCRCDAEARVRILTRKPVRPRETEIEANPRARSAKLRVAERVMPERVAAEGTP
ncbi:MAG: 16S rRNA (cytosine(1402)-N(4))-methyltransferase RsmH [Actinomycetota bacterium]|nr:16S rRNA (cytosine(1402)-N(4))-methyltransferase RsmH [Actinomycetota bacterium]